MNVFFENEKKDCLLIFDDRAIYIGEKKIDTNENNYIKIIRRIFFRKSVIAETEENALLINIYEENEKNPKNILQINCLNPSNRKGIYGLLLNKKKFFLDSEYKKIVDFFNSLQDFLKE